VTPIKKTFQYGDHTVTLETGEIARQADADALVRLQEAEEDITCLPSFSAPSKPPKQPAQAIAPAFPHPLGQIASDLDCKRPIAWQACQRPGREHPHSRSVRRRLALLVQRFFVEEHSARRAPCNHHQ